MTPTDVSATFPFMERVDYPFTPHCEWIPELHIASSIADLQKFTHQVAENAVSDYRRLKGSLKIRERVALGFAELAWRINCSDCRNGNGKNKKNFYVKRMLIGIPQVSLIFLGNGQPALTDHTHSICQIFLDSYTKDPQRKDTDSIEFLEEWARQGDNHDVLLLAEYYPPSVPMFGLLSVNSEGITPDQFFGESARDYEMNGSNGRLKFLRRYLDMLL